MCTDTARRPAATTTGLGSGPVRIDPDVRFGKPAIKGISTEVIWEQDDAGEDAKTIAEIYQIEVADVRWALAYENAHRAQAA